MTKFYHALELLFQAFHLGPDLLLKDFQVFFNSFVEKDKVNSSLNMTPFNKFGYQ